MTVAPGERPRPVRQGLDRLHPPGRTGRPRRDRGRRPAGLAARGSARRVRAFEALPAETNLLYTTYIDLRGARARDGAPYVRRAADRAVAAAARPTAPTACSSIARATSPALALSAEAAAAGVSSRRSPSCSPATRRVRELLDGGVVPARRRPVRPADPGALDEGVVLDVPAGVRLDAADRHALGAGAPDRASSSPDGHRARRRRRGDRRRGVVAVRTRPRRRSPSRSSPARSRSASARARGSRCRASRSCRPDRRVPAPDRGIGEGATLQWALAQLGSRLVRSRVDNRLEGDRSSVEQVEIVFGGAEQLFDLTSYTRHVGRDTTGNLLSKGALLDEARAFLKGMITIERSAVGTDSFLGEFGMNLSKEARSVAIPSPRDRPARLPARGACQLGRADRRDPAVLPGEPRDRARRGPQVHRPRLPGAGRGPRAAGRGAGSPAGAARGEVGRQGGAGAGAAA